jgi:hypothetical protein
MNILDAKKKKISSTQQCINYLAEYKEMLKKIVIVVKFVVSVRGRHCHYSPRATKNIATPLFLLVLNAD